MNGIITVNKPAGWTSHDVVAKLRGILHVKRIGHSGTLDPMATGVLPVFVGRATRAVEFCENDCKEYIAGFRLGVSTDTQDITGEVSKQSEVSVSEEMLLKAAEAFKGHISQVPPMYSAVKVGGKKLYELARKGTVVERKPRDIEITKLEISEFDGTDGKMTVGCSKGTYIRTLCNDIGEALGCGACMTSLIRTKAGRFLLENAVTVEEVAAHAEKGTVEEIMLAVDEVFGAYPSYTASAAAEKRCRCGGEFKAEVFEGLYRVYSESGEFLMLGAAENGIMKTVKNFFEV